MKKNIIITTAFRIIASFQKRIKKATTSNKKTIQDSILENIIESRKMVQQMNNRLDNEIAKSEANIKSYSL